MTGAPEFRERQGKKVVAPYKVGYFIPEPAAGKAAPQTNDVDPRAD